MKIVNKIILIVIFIIVTTTIVYGQEHDISVYSAWIADSPLTLQVIVAPFDYSKKVDKSVIIITELSEDLRVKKIRWHETSVDIRCAYNWHTVVCSGNRVYAQTMILIDTEKAEDTYCNSGAITYIEVQPYVYVLENKSECITNVLSINIYLPIIRSK